MARVSARIGRASCGAADWGTIISRRCLDGGFFQGTRRTIAFDNESAPFADSNNSSLCFLSVHNTGLARPIINQRGLARVNSTRAMLCPVCGSWAMRKNVLGSFRSRVAGGAEGRVLVIGIGSWLNLPLYDGAARCVIGIGESLFG